MTAPDPLIEIERVGVSYRRTRSLFRRAPPVWALEDVSMEVRRGESLGVVGRNGAGKSTLLKLLAGTILPDRGRIHRHGAHAALLTMQVGLLNHLSGRENAMLSGMLLGMTRREARAQMDRIIELSELDAVIDDPVGTYSSGMRARLGFAVAFQIDPDVLLIDEMLGVGDAAFREKSGRLIRERIRSEHTVVLVSHNGASIRRLCDRAVWIERGRVVRAGPGGEVVEAYEASLVPAGRDAERSGSV